ncbi:MAG TPA: MFS transporter [Gemmatimonadales bacterium]|jgi:MFS family permease|nr:MFS transporter [Gemmatimonadales bacterium]
MTEAVRRYGLGALAHRNFRLFLFGQTVSLTGTWMQSIAQGWLVLQLTNSPFYVGLVSALSSLGVLLLTLYAGVVADRTDKRRMVVITQTLLMLQAFALAGLVWTRTVTVESVMALAAFLGIVNAFDIPTRQSFIVEMVGKDDLMNAIALNSSVFNATRVFGPAVAGVLIGSVGTAWCFALNGVSYLAVIGGLLAMRLPPRVPQPAAGSAWTGIRESVAFIRSDPRVFALVVLTALFSVFGFPFLVLMPVVARDVLHAGAAGYGALTAAVGVGALLGALSIAVWSGRIPKGRTLVAGGTSFGVALALFASSRSFPLSVALVALAGCAMILNNALTNTLLQTLVPDELRGRVMGFYSFVFVGLAPLGALQAGALAEHFGAPWAVAVGGVITALAMAAAAWRVVELRRAA